MKRIFLLAFFLSLFSCEKSDEPFQTLGRIELTSELVLNLKVRKASFLHSEYDRRIEVLDSSGFSEVRDLHMDLDGDITLLLDEIFWREEKFLMIDDGEHKYLISKDGTSFFYLFLLEEIWYVGPVNGEHENLFESNDEYTVSVGKEEAVRAQGVEIALQDRVRVGKIDWHGFQKDE